MRYTAEENRREYYGTIGNEAKKAGERNYVNEKGCFPGILQAVCLLVFLFFLLVIAGGIIDLLGFFREEAVIVSISNTVSFALVLWWGSKRAGASFREIFPLRSFPVISLIPMGLVIIGISILGSELDNVFRVLLPPPDWLTHIFLRLAGFETSLFGSVLALVVVAPMTEELLFRGLIMRGFLSRYAVGKAIFASAILFGIFHLNPWQFVHTTIIGILLAWWFVRTKSLVPCILGHALNNALVFIYRDIFGLDITGYTTPGANGVQFQPFWLDLLGGLLLLLGLAMLIRVFGKAGQSTL